MEPLSSPLAYADLLHLEERLWVLTASTGVANYDFRFDTFFHCRQPWQHPDEVTAIARFGAIAHYEPTFAALKGEGITLLHSPAEYIRASELPGWYPFIADLTPKSLWFSGPPDVEVVAAQLGWPMFLKGVRQTSRHRRELSIIAGPEQLEQALAVYTDDPILRWQGLVCREYVPLRLVEDVHPERLPSAFEFRTFWWRGALVGCGRYWYQGRAYHMTDQEEAECLAVAGEAAQRLQVPFLVVDITQAADGRWLVIECNEGQESGYGGVVPVSLWQRVLDIE